MQLPNRNMTTSPVERRNVRIVAAVLVIATVAVALPLWPALLMALWTAALCRPLMLRISRFTKGRDRAAAVVTAMLALVILAPFVLMSFAAVHEATGLYAKMRETGVGKNLLVTLVSPSANGNGNGAVPSTGDVKLGYEQVIGLAKTYGASAWNVALDLGGTVTSVVIAVFVYLWATLALLSDGPRLYAWLESSVDLPSRVVRAFSDAFVETGRGLFFGVGMTSFVQAVVATITYVALGVPRAMLLGFITLFMSIIPALGTGFVWVPICIGFALSGAYVKCAIMAAIGLLVIGSVDNLARPMFARFGKLQMSSFALFTSMIGGILIVGPFGILLGPLVVRLGAEALEQKKLHAPDEKAVVIVDSDAEIPPIAQRRDGVIEVHES